MPRRDRNQARSTLAARESHLARALFPGLPEETDAKAFQAETGMRSSRARKCMGPVDKDDNYGDHHREQDGADQGPGDGDEQQLLSLWVKSKSWRSGSADPSSLAV